MDRVIAEVDRAVYHIFCPQPSSRPYPAEGVAEAELSPREKRLSAALMRVNHAGEICAQALYQGQSIIARDPRIAERLQKASIEEADHLNWCLRRIEELGGRRSLLDPLWYLGSLAIGIAAGIPGDRWNLAFLAETERQVAEHLDGHLRRLPPSDARTRAIVEQMKEDELKHKSTAEQLGAAEMPGFVRKLMRLAAKVMTTTAERI
ncbi:MAG: 2-polyprenyl-3-methyl-6-methoxy-1,4-benzoquinone monooxygenase [Zetaproteobacteria bacterium]|nr:MAG: 2-polyprenyl-3-methyl-6-methoxy-1,4-benzoquinone monooxygenase [Zetaproteobacteria bacterium]